MEILRAVMPFLMFPFLLLFIFSLAALLAYVMRRRCPYQFPNLKRTEPFEEPDEIRTFLELKADEIQKFGFFFVMAAKEERALKYLPVSYFYRFFFHPDTGDVAILSAYAGHSRGWEISFYTRYSETILGTRSSRSFHFNDEKGQENLGLFASDDRFQLIEIGGSPEARQLYAVHRWRNESKNPRTIQLNHEAGEELQLMSRLLSEEVELGVRAGLFCHSSDQSGYFVTLYGFFRTMFSGLTPLALIRKWRVARTSERLLTESRDYFKDFDLYAPVKFKETLPKPDKKTWDEPEHYQPVSRKKYSGRT